jgi:hypothetical protein
MNFSILRNKLFWIHGYQEGFQTEWFRDYQEVCRIYLDEYEVEEWDYLPLFDNTFVMDRFMEKK